MAVIIVSDCCNSNIQIFVFTIALIILKSIVTSSHCLLRRPWPLPSDREIPGYWENLESKVKRAYQSRTRPVPLN